MTAVKEARLVKTCLRESPGHFIWSERSVDITLKTEAVVLRVERMGSCCGWSLLEFAFPGRLLSAAGPAHFPGWRSWWRSLRLLLLAAAVQARRCGWWRSLPARVIHDGICCCGGVGQLPIAAVRVVDGCRWCCPRARGGLSLALVLRTRGGGCGWSAWVVGLLFSFTGRSCEELPSVTLWLFVQRVGVRCSWTTLVVIVDRCSGGAVMWRLWAFPSRTPVAKLRATQSCAH